MSSKLQLKIILQNLFFIENEVLEDYVTSRNPKDALYKTLCLVARYYPELLKAETSKAVCCEETDDELQSTT